MFYDWYRLGLLARKLVREQAGHALASLLGPRPTHPPPPAAAAEDLAAAEASSRARALVRSPQTHTHTHAHAHAAEPAIENQF
jgi:hypothetical protein